MADPMIQIEENRNKLFTQLTEGDMPFTRKSDVFLTAACVGYKNGNREPLESRADLIKWANLKGEGKILLRALGLVEAGDREVLAENKKLVEIAEEYANGGINDLYANIVKRGGSPLMNLMDLMPEGQVRSQ